MSTPDLNRLRYQFNRSRRHLILNGGQLEIGAIDVNNSCFSAITDLINQTNPKSISVRASRLHPKLYLMICRALLHTSLPNFELRLSWIDGLVTYEDLAYPLAKTLGATLRCQARLDRMGAKMLKFAVTREPRDFSHALGFYIVSNGANLDRVRAVLQSIQVPAGVSAEIAVVGPASIRESELIRNEFPQVKVIDDKAVYASGDKRFPISAKKNLILDQTRAEIAVILHDRIHLGSQWTENLLARCRHFDLYTCRVTSADGRSRYMDKFSIRHKGSIQYQKSHYYLTYDEDNIEQLVDGGFFVINRKSLAHFRFDPDLHWSEMEDIDLVQRIRHDGGLVSFDRHNSATSLPGGHFLLPLGRFSFLTRAFKIWGRRCFFSWRIAHAINHLRWVRKNLQGRRFKSTPKW